MEFVPTGRVAKCMAFLLLPIAAGCVAAPGEEISPEADVAMQDGPTGTTSQALNLSRGFWEWGRRPLEGNSLDIGPSDGQTCFLAGVGGWLGGAPTDQNQFGGGGWAGVSIDYNTHRYHLDAHGWARIGTTGNGTLVKARAVCVGTSAGRIFASWKKGDPPMPIGAATTNRQCFLASVYGGHGEWTSSNDRIRVTNESGTWYINGVEEGFGNMLDFGGSAVCFDAPPGTYAANGDWGLDGMYTSATRNVWLEGAPSVCGLVGLRGMFTNTEDGDDGVFLQWPSTSPGQWKIKIENGGLGSSSHRGYVRCLQ